MVFVGNGLRRVNLGGPPGGLTPDMQRAHDCVNALANRDPSKLAALEAAVEIATRFFPELEALQEALAAFRGQS
jgi:hypothetical protein